MASVYEVKINGDISYIKSLAGIPSADIFGGSVSASNSISGDVSVPYVLDRTAIHYDTTASWNSQTLLIAQAGHVYVYSDYTVRENEDGTTTNIPAIKIGDGSSYLIDMPFTVVGDSEAFVDHINNMTIHVSEQDRTDWDNKVSVSVNETQENLILNV